MSNRSVQPSRRQFLIRAAGGLAAVGLGSWSVGGIVGWLSVADRGAELRGLIRDRATATALGRHYLAATPGEANEGRLVALLTDRHSLRPVREQVRRHVRDDFTAGRTVMLDGWIFSRAEARLFALAALG